MTRVAELFTENTSCPDKSLWAERVRNQHCKYLGRKCLKIRKSQPSVSIGTCSVYYGQDRSPIVICPHRLLERKQIFTDCLHLLTLHQPGNEFHVLSEITIPGGSVDYFLLSVKNGRVKDFVGIELQTLDTTGTVWPERQRFLQSVDLRVKADDVGSAKLFGMNWKMTAKTILVQLHHKVGTFEGLNKHLIIVLQDQLLQYMRRQFSFDHVNDSRLGDPLQVHSYSTTVVEGQLRLGLSSRLSTDTDGVALSLGLQAESSVDMGEILAQLEARISDTTLLPVFPIRSDEVASTD